MDVKISLQQTDNVSSAEISSTDDEKYVWLTLRDNKVEVSAKVLVEEMKQALRKMCTK